MHDIYTNEKNASSFWSRRLRQLKFKLTFKLTPLPPLSWRKVLNKKFLYKF